MINKNTFKFLKDLKLNNSKEWLEKNKEAYENAKNNILTLTTALITSLSDIDQTISDAYLDAKKSITRLNRDLRFAKDKTPYKTDYYIVLNKNGKNSPSAFYFVLLFRLKPLPFRVELFLNKFVLLKISLYFCICIRDIYIKIKTNCLQ